MKVYYEYELYRTNFEITYITLISSLKKKRKFNLIQNKLEIYNFKEIIL